MRRGIGFWGCVVVLGVSVDGGTGWAASTMANPGPPGAPEYYKVYLAPMPKVPGMGAARGEAEVRFSPSPFGVALTRDGSYLYDLTIALEGLPTRPGREYRVWVSTPEVDRVRYVGKSAGSGVVAGQVEWNKFLVVVTEEALGSGVPDLGSLPAEQTRWSGPIVMRGMSRSGKMHSMAGHDPLRDQESCAAYGYNVVECR